MTGTIGPLEGEWLLAGYRGADDTLAEPLDGTEITARFGEDGRVSGSGGCNRYFASFRAEGGRLEVAPPGCTMMACDPDVNAQETRYLSLLERSAAYRVEGGRLRVEGDDGRTVLVFARRSATALTEAPWVASGVNNGRGGVVSSRDDAPVTLTFGEDGTLLIEVGRRRARAHYAAEGSAMTIRGVSPPGPSPPGDDDAPARQERDLVAALGRVATFELSGRTLTLRAADGAAQVVLRSADAAG